MEVTQQKEEHIVYLYRIRNVWDDIYSISISVNPTI